MLSVTSIGFLLHSDLNLARSFLFSARFLLSEGETLSKF